MPKLTVFAATKDDINQGWVWLGLAGHPQRGIVRLSNAKNGKHIFCEALSLDSNYLAWYNQAPRRTIHAPETAIIANEWYRTRLGIDKGTEVDLDVASAGSAWGRLRASLDHPQNVVRLATWLAVWSVFLGMVGIILGVAGIVLGWMSLCH